MYTLIRSIPIRRLLSQQVPAVGGSLLLAEFFYKFGSFGLECLAFLATWFVFDATMSGITALWRRHSTLVEPAP